MFHSIGCEKENWYRNWLSVSLDHFEAFCKHLVKNNYETVFLDSWYDLDDNNTSSKQVIITFDDGYLDNWVYAYPILKKYNLKGTIFVNPEFVDLSDNPRKNLSDVWDGSVNKENLQPLGFLNWSELKTMEASGVMDIQSHSMSHNFNFQSEKIKDIYTGQPNYDWMAWISNPERKPYYTVEDQTKLTNLGTPIFDFGRALALRKYFPDEKVVNYAVNNFKSYNEDQKETFINELNDKIKEFPGSYESDEDMEKRYRYELFDSKRILEEKLDKTVDFLCWPGGGYNDMSVKLSLEAGYKASTTSSKDKDPLKYSNKGYKRIKRFAMGSFISTNTGHYYVKNSNYLVSLFKKFEGSSYNRNLYRFRKLGFMIKEKIGL